jgi:subtilase family serine protease
MKIAAGASFIASDTVTNQGNGASTASVTRYYLALGTTRAAGDVTVGTRNVAAIAPAASLAGNAFVTVPAATTPASYYLIACADDNLSVSESNETNNCRTSVKQVAVTGPDLTETAVPNPPATVNVGAVITVSDTAKNIGNGDAPGSVTRYYLSNDGLKSASDLPLGSRVVGPLQVNKSSSGSASVTIPGTAGGATWFLLACADDDGTVVESSETNNCRAANKSVHVN